MSPATRAPGRHGWLVVAAFLITRAGMLGVWRYGVSFITGDVGYYWTSVRSLPYMGIGAVMREYPVPVVWGLAMLRWLAADVGQYLLVFGLAMLALDAAFTRLLWRETGRRRGLAVAFWIAFVPLVGPIMFFRFDLLPAVLAGAGLLWLRRSPSVAGALVAAGAAIKLWPALLVLPLLADRSRRARVGTGFLATGVGLAGASWALAGWRRLVSPLAYQSDRGLQVESLAATPVMLLRTFAPVDQWRVGLSIYNAFEISGPGVTALLGVSSVLTLAGLAAILLLCWRLLRGRPTTVSTGLVVLAIVAIMLVTNKTLSPQYVVWLGGPLAVLVGQWDTSDARGRRTLRGLVLGSMAVAALTQLVYPFCYDWIVMTPHGEWFATLALAGRNVLLLAWTCWLVAIALSATRVPAREAS